MPWVRYGLEWPKAVVALLDHCAIPACDFANIYLPQARGLFEGFLDPRWFYPPLLALLLQGVSWMENWPALYSWLGLNLAAVVVLIGLCQRRLSSQWGALPALAASVGMVTLSLPIVHSLKWGQVSLLLTLMGLVGLGWPGRKTGPLMGLAVGIKLYPAAWMLVPLMKGDRGHWRAVAAFSLGLGVVVPLLALGVDGVVPFIEAVRSPVLGDHNIALGSQTVHATLHRWFIDGLHGGLVESHAPRLLALPSMAVTGLTAALLAGVAAAVWRLRDVDRPLLVTAVTLALALALPPGWHHYFALLPFAWAAVLHRVPLRSASAVLVGLAWAVSAAPLLLLADGAGVYFTASAYGVTTVAALLTLAAAALSVR